MTKTDPDDLPVLNVTHEHLLALLQPVIDSIRLGSVECFCVVAITEDGELYLPTAIRRGTELTLLGALEVARQSILDKHVDTKDRSKMAVYSVAQTKQ